MEWSEVYSSVQTGVIDGFVGATALTAASQFSDVIDYYYEVGLMSSVNCIVVSDVLWEKLTDEQKAAFQEYGSGMLEQSVKDYQEAAEQAYQQLEDAGVTVVIPTAEKEQELADLCRSNWGSLADDFGEEFYQGLAEEFGLNG